MPKKKRPLTAAQRERQEAREVERALDVIDRNVKARKKREQAEHALLERIDTRLKAAAGARRATKRKAKRKKKPAKRKAAKRAPKRKVAKKKRRKASTRKKAPARKRAPKRSKRQSLSASLEVARKARDSARAKYNFAKTAAEKNRARGVLERALIAYGEAARRAGV
jgi:hypothetical protein